MDPNSNNDGALAEDPEGTLTDMREGDLEASSDGDKLTYGVSSTKDMEGDIPNQSTDSLRNYYSEEGEDRLDVAQLVQSRKEALEQKQIARRAAWLEEVKEELKKRAEYWREMEGIPLNEAQEKDKERMSKVSKKRRKAFRNDRTKYLFSNVLLTLCKNVFRPCLISGEGAEGALSFLLGCRLVCSSWKEVVDQQLSIHGTSNRNHHNQCKDGIPDVTPQLSRLVKLNSFNLWSDLTYRGRNPFFTRKFSSGSRVFKEHLGYWKEVEKILQRWGGELWSVNFVFDQNSLEMMYIFLCKILSLTPNLRRLSFLDQDGKGHVLRFDDWTASDLEALRSVDVLGPLMSRMKRSPLPELAHLRSIIVGGGGFAPDPLVQAVLDKYGDSLMEIDIAGGGRNRFTGGYVDPGEFISGRALPIQVYSCFYAHSPQISHWSYQFPSLNQLSLYYRDVGKGVEVGNIIKTINSCGSILRRLLLTVAFKPGEAREWPDRLPKGLKLELPQLEMLELFFCDTKITNVDFLLPLVSLQELDFWYNYDARKPQHSGNDWKGVIQFPGGRDRPRLYESNIWKLLPELRLVNLVSYPITNRKIERLSVSVYDRDGYMKHGDK